MDRERITLEVHMDLDPVAGTFSTKESATKQIQALLNQAIPWYNPSVSTTEDK